MIAKCISHAGSQPVLVLPTNLERPFENDEFVNSTEWCTVYAEQVSYPALTVGSEYTVYGTLEYDGQKRYLICGDDNIPQFYHAELFDCIGGKTPCGWATTVFKIKDQECAFTTEAELSKSYNYLIGLVDTAPSAVSAFLEYKKHYEEWDIYCS